MDASGGLVVAWIRDIAQDNGQEIVVRRYGNNGVSRACAASIPVADCPDCCLVPTDAGADFVEPVAVASDADGDFVVARRQMNVGGEEIPIKARVFNSDGSLRSTSLITVTPGVKPSRQNRSLDVAMDTDGDFVVVWHDYDPSATPNVNDENVSGRVFARRFDSSGSPKRGAYENRKGVLEVDMKDSMLPSVAMMPSGTFLVAWDGRAGDIQDRDRVKIQKFGADGMREDRLTRVDKCASTSRSCDFTSFTVAADALGRFAIIWNVEDMVRGIASDGLGQRLRGTRILVGSQGINELANRVRIAIDADGDLLVAWAEQLGTGPDGDTFKAIRAQRYLGRGLINLKVGHALLDSEAPSAIADDRFGYRVKVTNTPMPQEPSDLDQTILRAIGTATDVKVIAEVPKDAQFPSGFGAQWNCLPSPPPPDLPEKLICEYLSPLPAAMETTELRLEYTAPSAPQMLKHTVRVDAAQRDRERANNRSTVLTQVVCPSDLPDRDPADAGPTLEFASPVANQREGTAVGLAVKVTNPSPGRGICFKLNGTDKGSAVFGSDYGFFRVPDPPRAPDPMLDCASSNRMGDQVFTVPPGVSEATVALICLTDDQKIEKARQAVFTLSDRSDQYRLGAPETRTFTLIIRDPGK
ncbi:MAG: hypothetical protein ACT4QA_03485 [Panacagrimonas sp.]